MGARFEFGLQRVLEMRERTEQERARALGTAQHAATARTEERDTLAREREAAAGSLHARPRSAGELRAAELVIAHMDRRVHAATAAAALAVRAVETAQLDLNVAFRDRRIIDRLKERARETWQTEAVQADRQLMDDIALARFGKRTPTSNDTAE